jgi:hypothetical protein
MDWLLNSYTLYKSLTRRHQCRGLLQSPLAVSWQRLLPREIFSASALECSCQSRPYRTLSTDNSTNRIPSWQPFHTNLLVFTPRADFQLTTELSYSPSSYFLSLHSTDCGTRLTLLITFWDEPHRKHRFQCCSQTIPQLLHRNSCLFIHIFHSSGYCLQNLEETG